MPKRNPKDDDYYWERLENALDEAGVPKGDPAERAAQARLDPLREKWAKEDAEKKAKGLLGKEDGATGSSGEKSISDQERESRPPDTNWDSSGVKGKPNKQPFLKRVGSNKKLLGGLGIGGGIGGLIIAAVMTFLPLKMHALIQNVVGLASQVPAYATEQRIEYLITRAIAARMLSAAHGGVDAQLVFCKGGGIACSLVTTKFNNYFENKLGIELSVEANGRTTLGGRASSWKVKPIIEPGSTVMNEAWVDRLTTDLRSNSEMKALIKQEVAKKGAGYSIVTRYLARKLLMKKYGVTNWRGPPKLEQAVNRYNDAKTNIKAGIIKNTIGKVMPRFAIYMTCLQDPATCEKLKEGVDGTRNTVVSPDDPNLQSPEEQGIEPDDPEYEEAQRRYEAQQAAGESVAEEIVEEADDLAEGAKSDGMKNTITKVLLRGGGGALIAIGVVDLIFSAVNSVEEGTLDLVWYDMASQTYTGFSSYTTTASDKTRINELDIDTVGAYTELFDGVEESPLYQAEVGLAVDTSEGIMTECNAAGGEKEKEVKKLAPGELVCEDQKLVRDYAGDFTNSAGWDVVAGAADLWVNYGPGLIIDFAGDAVGTLLSAIPGFNDLMALIGEALEPAIEWFISLFFEPPLVGDEASGPDNYVALSGGIRETQNAMMKYGVDEDGTAMGGGGRLLSDEEVATIVSEQSQSDQEYYDNQPMIAKFFDVDLTGSFAQRMLAKMPTSFGSILNLPSMSVSSLLTSTYTSAAATEQAIVNPFGIPLYGYTAAELDENPGTFTEAYCEASATEREASYEKTGNDIIPSYKKSDPCALEKMVVGTLLYDAEIYDDEYSFKRVTNVD